jgi:hypothetical protein
MARKDQKLRVGSHLIQDREDALQSLIVRKRENVIEHHQFPFLRVLGKQFCQREPDGDVHLLPFSTRQLFQVYSFFGFISSTVDGANSSLRLIDLIRVPATTLRKML